MDRIRQLEDNLIELLRLYKWRFKLAEMEKDPSISPTEIKHLLNKYGKEKKEAWKQAEKLVGK